MDYLKDKSQDEINRAATFWFMAQECVLRGERIPSTLFALSAKGVNPDDIKWAMNVIARMRWVEPDSPNPTELS